LFQLKALRKILRLTTTYVDRRNTNQKIIDKANEFVREEGGKKEIRLFRQVHLNSKLKRLKKIITQPNTEINQITFRRGIETHIPPNRLQGRPSYKWTDRALIDSWEEIQQTQNQYRFATLNLNSNTITQTIIQHAINTIDD